MTKLLAIESTAHTFAAAVIDDQKENQILSSERKLFTTESGGIIPVKLAEHHLENFDQVIRQALALAKTSIDEIEAVAFSRSPGIGHALRIGYAAAKSISLQQKIPLIGVNHCVAHLEIGRYFSGEEDPLLLYASGANTQIIAREAGKYRIFGETVDLGVGNFLDTIAREMGLGFPGGPKLEKLAATYEGELLELPYSVKGMDVSFSGMQTKVKSYIQQNKSSEQIAYSVQEWAFAMLVEVTERALAHTQKTSVVIGGGVGCNQRLQEMLGEMVKEHQASFHAPPKEYLIDNAAMIGLLGAKLLRAGYGSSAKEMTIDPYERTDQVKENDYE